MVGNTKTNTVKGKAVSNMSYNGKFKGWLEESGINFDMLKPKMEKYNNILKWNDDNIAYMAARAEIIKKFYELYSSLGDKGANFMLEITKLSYFMDMLEKQLMEEGKNPIENKPYMDALKRKQDLMVEVNKLKLDVEKAKANYVSKKIHGENPDDDYDFTFVGED